MITHKIADLLLSSDIKLEFMFKKSEYIFIEKKLNMPTESASLYIILNQMQSKRNLKFQPRHLNVTEFQNKIKKILIKSE